LWKNGQVPKSFAELMVLPPLPGEASIPGIILPSAARRWQNGCSP
jgi:hypothetical protein